MQNTSEGTASEYVMMMMMLIVMMMMMITMMMHFGPDKSSIVKFHPVLVHYLAVMCHPDNSSVL